MSDIDVKEWIKVAEYDINAIKILIKENGPPSIIIYHIHQALEKLLKALIIQSGGYFEKIHKLDKLLAMTMEKYPEIIIMKNNILEIDLYLPKLRYPYGDDISFKESLEIYKKFENVYKIINKYLPGLPQ